MTTITLQPTNQETYRYDFEYEELMCNHDNAYIEKACCPAGTQDCGCHGLDAVVCPNADCTEILDHEIDGLFERLQ